MERFWSKVNKTDTCWLWTRATRSGYGAFKVDGKVVSSHRYIWEQTYNCSVLPWVDVCHTCDIPICVNVNHMFLGTRKDNMVDCKQKNRMAPPPVGGRFQAGELHPSCKLTDDQVEEIKLKYEITKPSLRSLANEYGVDHSRIWQIVRGDR